MSCVESVVLDMCKVVKIDIVSHSIFLELRISL